uniref:Uncharacterized protein n=1 Tax=Meloidogyne enterolobii TaxID=390850 RepID=A0A6V7U9X6_MELEN|nr:unnamed protein product [Meloidogyne enterolobii]
MNIIPLQAILALAMFLTTALAGLLPIKLLNMINRRRDEENERETRLAEWILSLLSCFAGGVFMGTCFLDIFPHINENYERFIIKSKWKIEYPLTQFFVCCGFFLVYLLEELILKIFSSSALHAGHSHSAGNNNSHHHKHRRDKIKCREEHLKTSNIVNSNNNCNSDGNVLQQSTHVVVVRRSDGEESDSINSSKQFKQRSISILTQEYLNNEQVDDSLLKSITFAVAMSFHSILEGFALGVQNNQKGIMTLFISLIIHKGIEAFSVGLQITRSNAKRMIIVVLTIGIYALMTPFGSMVGVLLTNLNIDEVLKDGIVIVLESFAGGTFIYVTFFEVLSQERANEFSNLVQLCAIVFGFLVVSVLQINESIAEKYVERDSSTNGV